MKITIDRPLPRAAWLGAVCLLLLPTFSGATVFDFSPKLRDALVTQDGGTVFYRIFDPERDRYVSQEERVGPVRNLELKDGLLYWTDGIRVYARTYDGEAGQWKKTEVVAGNATDLTSASGVLAWISQGFVYHLVYDASREQWQDRRIAFSGTPGGLMTRDGLVAWQNQSAAFYAAYDPGLGRWRHDLESSGAPPQQLRIRDGVVTWHNGSTVFCRIYDAMRQAWKGRNVTSGGVRQLMSEGGAVAWANRSTVYYAIYDPTRGAWIKDQKESGTTTNLTVRAGTVQWTSGVPGEDDFIRGYDTKEGRWGSLVTPPLAFFTASATSGDSPLRVYLMDMSVGASAWGWSLGEGDASFRRSPCRAFPPGVHAVTQTVTDPNERSDSHRLLIVSGLNDTGAGGATLAGPGLAQAPILQAVDGVFHATIVGAPGQQVMIEASTDLEHWVILTVLTNESGSVQFMDADAAGAGQRYYRVKVME